MDTPDPQSVRATAPSSDTPRQRRLPSVPEDILHRYNARVLDPSTAPRNPGQPMFRSTVYIADRLILNGGAGTEVREALKAAAERNGAGVVFEDENPDPEKPRSHVAAALAGLGDQPTLFSTGVRLVPMHVDGQPAVPPDAWQIIQDFRTIVTRDSANVSAVALDHLIGATPYVSGVPYIGGVASTQYASPGFGGRAPVNWIGAEPTRKSDKELGCRRPVVVTLDTGIGSHPWLDDPKIVTRELTVQGETVGIDDTATSPEGTGVVDDPYEGTLDPDAGHGTFIAGLIRQKCPDANIIGLRVMSSDGAVSESVLLETLKLLVIRQQTAQAQVPPNAADVIDVLSFSLGYYHEQPTT